jgi:hypothetical protein
VVRPIILVYGKAYPSGDLVHPIVMAWKMDTHLRTPVFLALTLGLRPLGLVGSDLKANKVANLAQVSSSSAVMLA